MEHLAVPTTENAKAHPEVFDTSNPTEQLLDEEDNARAGEPNASTPKKEAQQPAQE